MFIHGWIKSRPLEYEFNFKLHYILFSPTNLINQINCEEYYLKF